ncbi:MAG TPA: response regulator transcription factor [Nocardioides sp.]|nr:response regulator transcription factor [Nocardioides sp.]
MRSPRHVVVTSDQSLVADTVSAALAGPDLAVTRLPWRETARARVPVPRPAEAYDVGVLISDLQPLIRLVEAQRLLEAVPTAWIVLTGAPRGPLWGAVIEAGAAAVLRSSCSLAQLRAGIDRVAAREPLMSRGEQVRLQQAWRGIEAERRRAVENVRSLSPRESEVLALMHAGESVGSIADRLGVSEATVRSQVRAVLRKLDVRSQLAAVAAYDTTREQIGDQPP